MSDSFVDESKIVTIFSGYNCRAVVSFIRTLEKNRIKYVIIAKNNKDPIFKTAYKDSVVLVRETRQLELEHIKKYVGVIQEKFNVAHLFVAPSTEALNRFLQKERVALENLGVIIPLCDPDTYVSLSDKKAFGDICRNNEIRVPGEYNSVEDAVFPFVAKPRMYVAPSGAIYTPFLIFDNEQKKSFLQKCDPDEFYFQEYVEGRSIYLLYYFHRNGKIFKFSQENIAQQPEGKSIVAAVSSDFHNAPESLKYEKMLNKAGFHGLAMVEIKVSDGSNNMIEANPRFWGPSQLFADANMNLFEVLLQDYGFIQNTPDFHHPKESKYFWFGGIQGAFRNSGELHFHKGCEYDLLMDLDTWIQHDIYRRVDTLGVFKEEMV